MFFAREWLSTTIEEFVAALDAYIRWYNEARIKSSLGFRSPAEYRSSLGLAAQPVQEIVRIPSGSDLNRERRETGKEQRVQVPHSKGVANRVVPESCAAYREVRREALTGVHAGQPLSRVRNSIRVPTLSDPRKATRTGAPSQAPVRPGVVEDPGMHARSLHGNREISSLTVGACTGRRPASGR